MDKPSEIKIDENGKTRTVKIEIESTTKRYVEEMQRLFDFDLIKTLFKEKILILSLMVLMVFLVLMVLKFSIKFLVYQWKT